MSTSEGHETTLHTSGGAAVVDASGGKVGGLEDNEGRVAENVD